MSDDEAVRVEAVARLKRKRKFFDDLAGYVVVNGVLWLIWALTGHSSDGVPWPVWVTAIWGFLLVLDGLKAFGPGLGRGPITEAEVEREMRRLGHG
jgi:hypothetical protein